MTVGFNLLLSLVMTPQPQLKQDDKAKRLREGSWVPGLAGVGYLTAART